MGQAELLSSTAYSSLPNNGSRVETGAVNTPARAPYRIRHRGVFIGLISTILVLCFTHLAIGIYIAVAINPADIYYDDTRMIYYSAGTLVSRVRMVFFWITIPAVFTGLSIFEIVRLSRNRLPSKWIAGSAVVGGVIWSVQLAIEGSCMFSGWPSTDQISSEGLCPWVWEDSNGLDPEAAFVGWVTPFLVIPVLCMYVVYFSVGMRAVVIDKRDRKEASATVMKPVEDSLSLRTVWTSPVAETLATETLHPSTRATSTRMTTRPPSYFSDRTVSFYSYDTKRG